MHVCFSLRLNIGPNNDRHLIKNHIALSQDAVVQNNNFKQGARG